MKSLPTPRPMTSFSLALLVRPLCPDVFLEERWDRESVQFPGALAGCAEEILSLSSFEALLSTLHRADQGWLHFARGGRRSLTDGMLDSDGMLDLRRIRAAFADGESLYLTKAERLAPPLMAMCRAVEQDLVSIGVGLRRSVNAHVFLTPPRSRAFPGHRDEHASFVLQLDGSKDWTVFDPRVSTDDESLERAPGLVEPSALAEMSASSHLLEAGDVLYVPESWPHAAETLDKHSLHVTLRVFSLRWVDVLLDLCKAHAGLCVALPRHVSRDPQELRAQLEALVRSPRFATPLPSVVEKISRRHSIPTIALPDNGFRQILDLDRVDLDTPLVKRPGVACEVFGTGDAACVGFPGGVIRGPSILRTVFEYVVGAPIVRARELPTLPGVEYDRLDVVRTMIRDGLLRIGDDAEQARGST